MAKTGCQGFSKTRDSKLDDRIAPELPCNCDGSFDHAHADARGNQTHWSYDGEDRNNQHEASAMKKNVECGTSLGVIDRARTYGNSNQNQAQRQYPERFGCRRPALAIKRDYYLWCSNRKTGHQRQQDAAGLTHQVAVSSPQVRVIIL